MKKPMETFAEQSITFVSQALFAMAKTLFVVALLLVGGLLAAQSSVAPVSWRLLSSYGTEYITKTIMPYRHWFPAPQTIEPVKK